MENKSFAQIFGELPLYAQIVLLIFWGGIIGGIIGFRINRKIVLKATEILKQIEELQKED